MLYTPPDAAAREAYHMGANAEAYRWMGAHKTDLSGDEWQFTVWAPHAQRVCLTGEFCDWHYEDFPMEKQFDGTWELRLPASLFDPAARGRTEPDAGEKLRAYKYAILCSNGEWHLRSDPYGFCCELRPDTASRLMDIGGYEWGDSKWMRRRKKADPQHSPLNIYEMHLGSWRKHDGWRFYSYDEIADELIPYLQDMGYTHVEFLPVMEHPLDMSWGYQVTGFFAPTSRYGDAFGLMRLIDRLHQAEIGVILDWVPAHFPRNEEGLRCFDGEPCYEHADPRRSEMSQWGTLLFDYGRGEVCSFLLSSACYWLEWYHADGIRCDAVSAMLYHDFCRGPGQWLPNIYGNHDNLEGIAFLQKLNETVQKSFPGVMMIAEESTAFPKVTHPVKDGGLGFGFKWNMGWMNDVLFYIEKDPIYRSYHHDKLTFSMMYAFSEHYILPFSHDEVVHLKHSMLDKQPGDLWQKFAGLRALLGYQLAHPGKKLNFMGVEFGQFVEWKFDSPLDWFLLVYEKHPELQRCVRDLNAFYRATPALWQIDDSWDGFAWMNADDNTRSILSFLRMDRKGNAVLCVTNFTPACYDAYRVPLPAPGTLQQALNTDDLRYNGSGKGNYGGPIAVEEIPFNKQPCSCEIAVPPLSTVFFTYKRLDPAEKAEKAAS